MTGCSPNGAAEPAKRSDREIGIARTTAALRMRVVGTFAAAGTSRHPPSLSLIVFHSSRRYAAKEAAVAMTFRIGLVALCAGALTFTSQAFATDPIKIGVIVSPSGAHSEQ